MQNDTTNQILTQTLPQPVVMPQPLTASAFAFTVINPYSTDPSDAKVPFLIEGLFRRGGLSALVAKPKHGKSSMARFIQVCVTQGAPFLGRETTQGDTLLISIEDPIDHINVCLKELGYVENPEGTEGRIYLIDRVAATLKENIAALRTVLSELPGLRLVVIDTLAKFVRIKDINDYNQWLLVFPEFRQLLRDFPWVSILCLIHAKKVTEDDPFDSMLGSSALRAEFDTSAAIYKDGHQHFFVTETRIGKAIRPCVLTAELVEVEGSEVVRAYSLGKSIDQVESEKDHNHRVKRQETMNERIIACLTKSPNECMTYKNLLEDVKGRTESVVQAINLLIADGVLVESGTKGSTLDPYSLKLDRLKLTTHDFIQKYKKEDGLVQ